MRITCESILYPYLRGVLISIYAEKMEKSKTWTRRYLGELPQLRVHRGAPARQGTGPEVGGGSPRLKGTLVLEKGI